MDENLNINKTISLSVKYVGDKTAAILEITNSFKRNVVITSSPNIQRVHFLLNSNSFVSATDPIIFFKNENIQNLVITIDDWNSLAAKNHKNILIIYYSIPLSIESYVLSLDKLGRDSSSLILTKLDDFEEMDKEFIRLHPNWNEFIDLCKKEKLKSFEKQIILRVMSLLETTNFSDSYKLKAKYKVLRAKAYEKIEIIKSYIATSECRQSWLNRYFGVVNNNDKCNVCNICSTNNFDMEIDNTASKIITFFRIYKKNVALEKLHNILIGKSTQYFAYPGYSILRGMNLNRFYTCIYNMLNRNLLFAIYSDKVVKLTMNN